MDREWSTDEMCLGFTIPDLSGSAIYKYCPCNNNNYKTLAV